MTERGGEEPGVARHWPWIAGLLFLHALCALRYPWEQVSFAGSWLRLPMDLLGILIVGFGITLRCGLRPWIVHPLTLALLLVPLFRFASSIMPVFYGKELDLYNDLDMLPGLVHLLLHRYGIAVQVLLSSLSLAALAALYYATFRSLAAVLRRRAFLLPGRRAAALLVLVFAAGWIDLTRDPQSHFAAEALLDDAAQAVTGMVASWEELRRYDERLAEAKARTDGVPTDLKLLGGVDVFVIFIESYGRCLFRGDRGRNLLESWSAPWQARLSAAGYSIGTAFAHPSVRGGNSSMAHAEFMSGVSTHTRRTFNRLLESDLESLPGFFAAAGYRCLNVQPAMPRAWEEGRFFGFTQDLFLPAFAYTARTYHWGTMPDQYALAYLLSEHLLGVEQPLFLQYVAVTSHAPFSMVPPYIEDWKLAATSAAFAGEPAEDYDIGWLDYVGHPRLEEAYLATIRYSLEAAFDFVTQLERDALVMILGDHQPPNVGAIQAGDTSFDVPFHILAKDPSLLEPFAPFGFTQGFYPAPDAGSFPTAFFLSSFLETFSTGETR